MTTHKKRTPVWSIVLASIGLCAFSVFIFGRYTIVHDREPAWSPDGKYIAFACEPLFKPDEPRVSFDDMTYYERVNGICMKELDSGKITWVTRTLEMRAPFWSPDSQKIAWVNQYEPYQLTIWDRVSGKYTQYPLEGSYDRMPVWSLDGTRIFFEGNKWLDLKSGKQFTLKDIGASVLSPNGRYVAYAVGDGTNELNKRMVIFDREANRTVFNTDIASADRNDWNWNPDSSILSWVAIPEIGKVQLGLTKIPTGETAYLLINDIGWPVWNVWSPAGDKFALMDETDYPYMLLLQRITCDQEPFGCRFSDKKKYMLRGNSPGHFSWSPDGKQIAYETTYQFGHVWIIDLETGQDYPLIDKNK